MFRPETFGPYHVACQCQMARTDFILRDVWRPPRCNYQRTLINIPEKRQPDFILTTFIFTYKIPNLYTGNINLEVTTVHYNK